MNETQHVENNTESVKLFASNSYMKIELSHRAEEEIVTPFFRNEEEKFSTRTFIMKLLFLLFLIKFYIFFKLKNCFSIAGVCRHTVIDYVS